MPEVVRTVGRYGIVRELGRGGGLVAATRVEAQQPTWVVTGVDATGIAAAAAAFAEDELRDHFAVAVEEGQGISLPIVVPGTGE